MKMIGAVGSAYVDFKILTEKIISKINEQEN